jgi:hypothetical protein
VFLGAFEKLWKATVSFAASLRLSVRMEQLASHWADFREIWFSSIFRKSVHKIQISYNSERKKELFYTEPNIHFPSYVAQFFLKLGIFQTNVVENIKYAFYIQ